MSTSTLPPVRSAPAPAREREPVHVTHVMLSLDVGGLERNVLNQVRHAPRLPQRVSIICLERPGTLADAAREGGATVHCLYKRPGIRPTLVGQLRHLFGELGTQVVHTHQLASLFYAGPAARFAGVPVVVHTEHGKERYATRRRTRWLGRLAGRFAQTFYCLTEDMAAEVNRHRIVNRDKLRVIHNGIDTESFLPAGDSADVRGDLGIPAEAPVVGTVGRLTPVKRQDVLIRAFAELKKQMPAAHLLVVGEGPMREPLQALARECEVAEAVHFAGYRSPTGPYIRAMDLFALTSDSEGMPQAAIEAAVCDVPIVATRVGGLPELIEHGRSGWLVPAGDSAALAEAFVALLSDGAQAAGLAAAAHERAVGQFDIRRMAAEYHAHFLRHLHLS